MAASPASATDDVPAGPVAPAADDAADRADAPTRTGGADRPDDMARVRTFTRWSLIFIAAMTVLLPVIDLADRDASSAAKGAIGVGLLVVGVEQIRLLLGAMGTVDARALRRPSVAIAGVAALALLAVPASDADAGSTGWWALPWAGLVGSAVLWLPAARRRGMIAGGAVLAAVVGGAAAAIGEASVLPAAISPAIVLVCVTGGAILQLWIWDVTVRLDEARSTAGEVAVLRERLRFAADLHDVQGHHLQAIALKAELARRLVGTDDDAARRNAAEVQELTLKALADTRALVHGYRRVGLVTELENAVQILRAAGVETTVTGTPERVPEALQPLFGSLVREGATNLLRHTRADRCTLSVRLEGAEVVLRVEDDGTARAAATDDDRGTGIVALGERFAAVGGRVDAAPLPDRGFALTGRAPR
ncbi:sensor histidine kinase [Patulibacter minatonensis]|uniref:sensor histidine kinase n=1 Tax=Patulibacter minatonensis TaxID=298163 RepID=UPI0004B6D1EF|nr:histidine kinase [Patulibacter minatonensis]